MAYALLFPLHSVGAIHHLSLCPIGKNISSRPRNFTSSFHAINLIKDSMALFVFTLPQQFVRHSGPGRPLRRRRRVNLLVPYVWVSGIFQMALKKDSRPAYRTGRRASLANSRCFRHGNDFFCCASSCLCTDTNWECAKATYHGCS
jgi:hypothetical protein